MKIFEFRVKDQKGNWRAISTLKMGHHLVMVYAFHKNPRNFMKGIRTQFVPRIRGVNL